MLKKLVFCSIVTAGSHEQTCRPPALRPTRWYNLHEKLRGAAWRCGSGLKGWKSDSISFPFHTFDLFTEPRESWMNEGHQSIRKENERREREEGEGSKELNFCSFCLKLLNWYKWTLYILCLWDCSPNNFNLSRMFFLGKVIQGYAFILATK